MTLLTVFIEQFHSISSVESVMVEFYLKQVSYSPIGGRIFTLLGVRAIFHPEEIFERKLSKKMTNIYTIFLNINTVSLIFSLTFCQSYGTADSHPMILVAEGNGYKYTK